MTHCPVCGFETPTPIPACPWNCPDDDRICEYQDCTNPPPITIPRMPWTPPGVPDTRFPNQG